MKLDLTRLHEAAHPGSRVAHPDGDHFSCNERPDETNSAVQLKEIKKNVDKIRRTEAFMFAAQIAMKHRGQCKRQRASNKGLQGAHVGNQLQQAARTGCDIGKI